MAMTEDKAGDRAPLPVNAIAPVVVALALLVAGVEVVLSLAGAGMVGGPAGIGWRLQAVQDWGFSPLVWEQVVHLGNHSAAMVRRFVTYAFVHGSFTHALFGAAMLLALGKFVGDILSWWAVLAVFFGGLLAGAVAFGLAFDGPVPLFGSYPGVYALIGAFTWIIWVRLGHRGENQLRAFRMIGVLLILQLAFAALGPWLGGGTFDFAFVADLAGFAAGFVLSVLVGPGGFRRLRARLRER